MAVDLLGYGASDRPDGGDVDLASPVSYLLGVLDAVERPDAVVVGHDLGGGIAQILVTTSPHRVRGPGVVNGVCYDAWPVPLVDGDAGPAPAVADAAGRGRHPAAGRPAHPVRPARQRGGVRPGVRRPMGAAAVLALLRRS